MNDKCPKCNNTSFIVRNVGPHVGLYCEKCGAWIRWIKQHKKKAHQMSIEEFVQEAAPKQASMTDEERTEAYFGKLPWEK